eukprot:scaffold10.g2467.t1
MPEAEVPPAAEAVLAELHGRFARFHHRNQSYVTLLSFLAFVTLFMTVLFLQRSAGTSYQVFSTLSAGLLPSSSITCTADVYSWLSDLLARTYVDPVCGDGTCEAPFEYAAYGRFGCRADCGRLQDIQNLTALQEGRERGGRQLAEQLHRGIAGSRAAAGGCHVDLVWDFSHPAGSIPATELLAQASWNLCPTSGPAGGSTSGCYFADDQRFDRLAGSSSVVVPDCPDGEWELNRDIFDKVSGAVRIVPLVAQAALARKVALALAAAGAQRGTEAGVLLDVEAAGREAPLVVLNSSLAAQHAAQQADAEEQVDSGAWDAATYQTQVEALEAAWESQQAELAAAVVGCPGLAIYDPLLGGPSQPAALCDQWANATAAAERALVASLRQMLLGRLAPAQAAAAGVLASGLQALEAQVPELYALASAAALAAYYVEGPASGPPPARGALTARALSAANLTAADLADRSQARLEELAAAEAAVLDLPEVQAALNLTAEGGTDYDYVSWQGSTTAYETCSLQSRTPQYVGACAPVIQCLLASSVDASGATLVSYSCPSSGLGATACGDACDTQALCAALCVCEPGCDAAAEVCTCDACTRMGSARQDPAFLSMQAAAGGGSASVLGLGYQDGLEEEEGGWGDKPAVGDSGGSTRQLRQSSGVQDVLSAVSALEQEQAALAQDVQALQKQVAAAAAAAQDTSIQEMIKSGQAAISAQQSTISDALARILGEQTQAAAAQAATVQALANLQTLQEQQLASQQAASQAAADQVQSITLAVQQGVVSLSQALELFRRARRQSLMSAKEALLSNTPCSSSATESYPFTVDSYPDVSIQASRMRLIGLSNRVVAGLLLYVRRGMGGACPSARFASLDSDCAGDLATSPFGVDPTFKSGTQSYDPTLADAATSIYNCSTLPVQTYNLTAPPGVSGTSPAASASLTNPPPYCAELYSPRSLPWGFSSFALDGFGGTGYPAFADINLSQDGAANWAQYLQDGLFLDAHTRTLLAQVVTYNSQLRVFGSSLLSFEFDTGGNVQVSSRIQTLRVELYVTPTDRARLVLELLLSACILYLVGAEARGLARAWALYRNPLKYFQSGWQVVDFACTALLAATNVMWWTLVWRYSLSFQLQLRYDVYADLGAQAARLALADGGAGLRAMHADFTQLQTISDSLAWYYAMTGFGILLLIARLLQALHFQPRLGVVTRSIARAGPDLLHFGLVFSLVFVGYSVMAHLIFGAAIQRFSSLGLAVNTCFAVLLGDISVNYDLEGLSGLQGVVGMLFFWSFEVLVFLVLLNFLLAIVVDAFSCVKERTTDTTGIHTELSQILSHLWTADAAAGDLNNDGVFDREDVLVAEQERRRRGRRLRVEGQGWVGEQRLRQILQSYVADQVEEAESDIESPTRRGGSKRALFSSPTLRGGKFSPSRKHLRPVADAELDKAARYAMLRFGESPGSSLDEEAEQRRADPGSPEGSGRQAGAGARSEPSPVALGPSKAAPTWAGAQAGQATEPGFVIAAVRPQPRVLGPPQPMQQGAGGSAGGSSSTNGQRLAATIWAQTEQHGLDRAIGALLQLQQGLGQQQTAMLEAQTALAAQQASLLHAFAAAGGDAGLAAAAAAVVAAAGAAAGVPGGGAGPRALPRSGSSLRERWASFREGSGPLFRSGSLARADSGRQQQGPGG